MSYCNTNSWGKQEQSVQQGDTSRIARYHTHRRPLIHKSVVEKTPEETEKEHDFPEQEQDKTILYTSHNDPGIFSCQTLFINITKS